MFAVAITEHKEKLWQTVGQKKVTHDKMPLHPSVVELNTQLLFLVLKSGIKPSEGGSQGGSQQRDPLQTKEMNDNIKISHDLFWRCPNAEKRCGWFRSFPNSDPLVPFLSFSLLFSLLCPPTFPAGQHEEPGVVSFLLKPGYQRP